MEDLSPNAKRIIEKLADVNKKDLRFFRIEEFIRMMTRNNQFSASCEECAKFENEISNVIEKIDVSIQNPGKERKRYDKLLGNLSRHQRKVHGFYPPYYHNYLFSFLGIIGGGTIGTLIGMACTSVNLWIFIVPFVIMGLLAGQIIGGLKDSDIRTKKKIL